MVEVKLRQLIDNSKMEIRVIEYTGSKSVPSGQLTDIYSKELGLSEEMVVLDWATATSDLRNAGVVHATYGFASPLSVNLTLLRTIHGAEQDLTTTTTNFSNYGVNLGIDDEADVRLQGRPLIERGQKLFLRGSQSTGGALTVYYRVRVALLIYK